MVTATIRTARRAYLPVRDWTAVHRALEASDLEIGFLMCRFTLSSAGGGEVSIEDRMEPLMQELCLHGARRLLSNRDHHFQNWDYTGHILLHADGDEVMVSGDLQPVTAFSRQALIASLLRCAADVLALMQRLHAYSARYDISAVPYLEGVLAEGLTLYRDRYGPLDQENL